MADDRKPLVTWLKLDKETTRELDLYLFSLKAENERWYANNAPANPDDPVREYQRGLLVRQIDGTRASLRSGQYGVISQNQAKAAESAAEMTWEQERGLRSIFQSDEQINRFKQDSMMESKGAVDAVVMRYLSSRKPLSERVYDTSKLQSGMLNKIIDAAISRGVSWKDLAKAVSSSINPLVAGGVSYAAKRLARTEINNAFHATALQRYQESDIVDFVQWHLSTSHPEGDECDDYADARVKEYPDQAGLWPVDEVPEKPHPNCFCYITPFLPSPEDFLDSLFEDDSAAATKQPVGVMSRNEDEWDDKGTLNGLERKRVIDKTRQAMSDGAKRFGVTVDEYVRKAQVNLKSFTDSLGIRVYVSNEVAGKVLKDGRYRSAFDVGGGIGGGSSSYMGIRDAAEKINHGSGVDKNRPVYGILYGDRWQQQAYGYGDSIFILKSGVRDRSTVTFGDSLNGSGQILASPLNNPDPYSVPLTGDLGTNHRRVNDIYNNEMSDVTRDYVEVQIHGGFGIEDIERVEFSKDMMGNGPDPETLAILRQNNIPYTMKAYGGY